METKFLLIIYLKGNHSLYLSFDSSLEGVDFMAGTGQTNANLQVPGYVRMDLSKHWFEIISYNINVYSFVWNMQDKFEFICTE